MIYIDSMLGKLARILRVFGVSCYYIDPKLKDSEIIKIIKEGDILITCDYELSNKCNSIYLPDRDIQKNISLLISKGIKLDLDNPYCYKCNVKLEKVDNKYKCSSCGKYFWRGKQWENLKKYLPESIETS